MIKIAVTDDHPLMAEGIRNVLNGNDKIRLMASWRLAQETLEDETLQQIDVLFLDINLPDMNGIELCKILLEKYNQLRIIAITSHQESWFLKNMMKAGAKGFLLKSASPDDIIEAIISVCRGKEYIQQEMKDLLLNESLNQNQANNLIPKLTRREKEILQLIAEEYTTQEMADKLFVSAKTVETHRQNLTLKFGVKNSVGLVRMAMEMGLL
ncbi:MAG: DNA-binding response regulator [Bacteroidetes bacterium]|nr:MAG: DNA-binding response regulator [Bacteroidota bacterium]